MQALYLLTTTAEAFFARRGYVRLPHRNAILGRASTAEELACLASPEAFHG